MAAAECFTFRAFRGEALSVFSSTVISAPCAGAATGVAAVSMDWDVMSASFGQGLQARELRA
nr:hypothetical protein [Brevundimonas diminuta]